MQPWKPLALLLVLSSTVQAGPEPVSPALVFSRPPDGSGRFEAEVYLESRAALSRTSVRLREIGDVQLDQPLTKNLRGFGPPQIYRWRVKGRLGDARGPLPPALVLEVETEIEGDGSPRRRTIRRILPVGSPRSQAGGLR